MRWRSCKLQRQIKWEWMATHYQSIVQLIVHLMPKYSVGDSTGSVLVKPESHEFVSGPTVASLFLSSGWWSNFESSFRSVWYHSISTTRMLNTSNLETLLSVFFFFFLRRAAGLSLYQHRSCVWYHRVRKGQCTSIFPYSEWIINLSPEGQWLESRLPSRGWVRHLIFF